MDLPSKEKTFEFDHNAESGKEYKGRFTVLCSLNVGQKHAMSLEKTRLLGGHPEPTADLAGFAVIFSSLRAKIIDAPDWWKQSQGGALIDDEDAIVALYNKVKDQEESWKADLKKKTEVLPETPATQS